MERSAEATQTGEEASPLVTEAIVAGVVLLAIYLLSVYSDPSGPGGFLVFVPFVVLVATYVLAFGSLVRRLT